VLPDASSILATSTNDAEGRDCGFRHFCMEWRQSPSREFDQAAANMQCSRTIER